MQNFARLSFNSMSVNPVYFPISPVASRLMSPLFSYARFLDSTHVSFVFYFRSSLLLDVRQDAARFLLCC